MPESPAERLAEAMASGDRQRAHDVWDAQCRALGHPPLDDEGQPIPDPLEQ